MRLPAPPEIRRLTAASPPLPRAGFALSGRLLFYECVDAETKAATSWICFSLSDPLNAGIGPPPTSTWCTTIAVSGFSWSRFGPTVPVEPAAFNVWQPPQPAEAKTSLPAAGSPCALDAAVVVAGVEVVSRGSSSIASSSPLECCCSRPRPPSSRPRRRARPRSSRRRRGRRPPRTSRCASRGSPDCASGGRTSR